MKNLPKLLVSILVCELAGILSTPFTIAAIPVWYASLVKPPFAPPNWVFGPVWTILYALMGVSLYLLWTKGRNKKKVKTALTYFFIQLALNFLWSVSFFGFRSPLLGFVNIIFLLSFIVLTIKHFYPLSKIASYLLIPYLLWVTFAAVLNGAILILN